MSRPASAEWEKSEDFWWLSKKPVRGRHWGVYDRGTTLDRYRYCYACRSWRRNPILRDWKPLIHNGKKP
jgi:hypothetical protein